MSDKSNDYAGQRLQALRAAVESATRSSLDASRIELGPKGASPTPKAPATPSEAPRTSR